jgi:hypothetical protein
MHDCRQHPRSAHESTPRRGIPSSRRERKRATAEMSAPLVRQVNAGERRSRPTGCPPFPRAVCGPSCRWRTTSSSPIGCSAGSPSSFWATWPSVPAVRAACCCASTPTEAESLISEPHVRRCEMRGRKMGGWLRVDAEVVEGDDDLRGWVRHGVTYARSLRPKWPPPGKGHARSPRKVVIEVRRGILISVNSRVAMVGLNLATLPGNRKGQS